MLMTACFLLAATAVVSAQSAAPDTGAYSVGPGDVLRVSSFEHKDISGEFQVADDGTITYPLLGQVSVQGLTPTEIAAQLKSRLEKDFFVDVNLTVEMEDYRSQPVTVLGQVGKPGTYFLRGRTTLTQLLAQIGGFDRDAGSVLELRRLETDDSGAQVQKTYTYNTSALIAQGEGENVILKGGDIIWVPAKQIFFITGEVSKPGRYGIEPGLTLMQALSEAGGQEKFASNVIEIHREVEGEKKILEFDIAQIRKGRVEDPAIESGDVVIVKRRFF